MAVRVSKFDEQLTPEELATASRYSLLVRWSPEDDAYIAEVPELEGVASHGGTVAEAAEMAHEAAAAWISVKRAWGRPIPQPHLFVHPDDGATSRA
jgi:predicted RNase H-like HicB family nuclease